MPTPAVLDTSLLIDGAQLGLLPQLAGLPFSFLTSDLIHYEVQDDHSQQAVQGCIERGELRILSLDAPELAEVVALQAQHRSLSLEDCSVWYLARREGGVLLTGDGALRRKAKRGGIEVHGSLWVLAQLAASGQLTWGQACRQLQRLQALNPRLPRTEVAALTERWCQQGVNAD